MPECPCAMYRNHGYCYHTGYKPTFRGTSPPALSAEKPALPRKARRRRPRAVILMFDFLDLLEQTKPGSSGLDPGDEDTT